MLAANLYLTGMSARKVAENRGIPVPMIYNWIGLLTDRLQKPAPDYVKMARNLIGEEGMANLRVASQKRSYKKKKKQRTYTTNDVVAVAKYLIKRKHRWGSMSKASRKFKVPVPTLGTWKQFLFDDKLVKTYKLFGVPSYLQKAKRLLQAPIPVDQPVQPKEPKVKKVDQALEALVKAIRVEAFEEAMEVTNAEWQKKLKGLIK